MPPAAGPSSLPIPSTRLSSPDGAYTAWIEVSSTALPIYQPELVGGVRRGFVESQVGSGYTICASLPPHPALPSFPEYQAYITVDGYLTASKVTTLAEGENVIRCGGTFNGEVEQGFIFSKPAFTSSPTSTTTGPSSKLGTITVQIRRARFQPVRARQRKPARRSAVGSVPEEGKKGLGAVTGLGPPEISQIELVDIIPRPGDVEEPVWGCEFVYMPGELLRAVGIAGVPGGKVGQGSGVIEYDDSSDSESDDEADEAEVDDATREVIERVKAQLAGLESHGEGSRTGGVVDLTMDDD